MTRIVVGVDDDRRVRQSLESLLTSSGYVALLFSSADEFLQSGRLAAASCLIADVRMSGVDGIELQRRIRLERPELPIIFISGHLDDPARRLALEGGAIGFMQKPFDPADLLAAIGQAIET